MKLLTLERVIFNLSTEISKLKLNEDDVAIKLKDNISNGISATLSIENKTFTLIFDKDGKKTNTIVKVRDLSDFEKQMNGKRIE